MPKIKNWSRSDKHTDRATEAQWKHDNSKSKVSVINLQKANSGRSGYSVSASIYRDGEYVTSKLGMKETDNLEDAMEFARSWMKKHPNP